jgi:tetratricopeptide (TPR) repeat protein
MWADLGTTRQYDFLTRAERDKMRAAREELRELRAARSWSRDTYLQLLIYNNFINGDWKRQHFYKPTPEQLAYVALYEWVNDRNFNGIMNQSAGKVDLTGAFKGNPIPTLLLEGKWDLTWGDEKPTILSRNHPTARMIVVEGAGHSIFKENPEVFFGELEGFVRGLAPVSPAETDAYRRHLEGWREVWTSSPQYHVRAAGWGKSGSLELARVYSPQWLDEITGTSELLRVGFALYDAEREDEALAAFVRMEQAARDRSGASSRAVALLWQGHMLDLLGRRDEAVARYRAVIDLNVTGGMQHGQYDLSYEFAPYAAERVERPFQRLANAEP